LKVSKCGAGEGRRSIGPSM
jgi:hypothetical protein